MVLDAFSTRLTIKNSSHSCSILQGWGAFYFHLVRDRVEGDWYADWAGCLKNILPSGSVIIKCPHWTSPNHEWYMVYNGYYKVMSNIPKMGHLPTPAQESICKPFKAVCWKYPWKYPSRWSSTPKLRWASSRTFFSCAHKTDGTTGSTTMDADPRRILF